MKDRTDEQLVGECLRGSQEAWSALIRRYRHLIYAVIRSYRLPDSDAADVFQSVCLELFNSLPHLRDFGALRKWLITVSSHQCIRWKKHQLLTVPNEEAFDVESVPDGQLSDRLTGIERGQMLSEAIDQLPRRCGEMVRLLFLEDPPIPYAELAGRLGLAIGSIGFIRRRCLEKLKAALERLGFPS